MVGSWARQKPTEDSDFDIVLLTGEHERFTTSDDWLEVPGNPPVVRRGQFGDITERRVELPSGLQVEFGIGRPGWAATNSVDAGTKRVVQDGCRILHDPDGLLARLKSAVDSAG